MSLKSCNNPLFSTIVYIIVYRYNCIPGIIVYQVGKVEEYFEKITGPCHLFPKQESNQGVKNWCSSILSDRVIWKERALIDIPCGSLDAHYTCNAINSSLEMFQQSCASWWNFPLVCEIDLFSIKALPHLSSIWVVFLVLLPTLFFLSGVCAHPIWKSDLNVYQKPVFYWSDLNFNLI